MLPQSRPAASAFPAGARLRGVDSLRFIAAVWVLLSHIGFLPLPDSWASSAGPLRWAIGLYHSMFSGIAAVMVFFIISGLVIHTPHASGGRPRVLSFWVRRTVRITV